MTLSTVNFFSYLLPNLQIQLKKYLKTAKSIDESLILAIVLRNYSTKPSYIFQLKCELKVWKYIFNLFHFEMFTQNRNPKFRPLCLFVQSIQYNKLYLKSENIKHYNTLFWVFMNTRSVLCLVFGWIINCPCLSFFLCRVVLCIIYVL